MNMDLDSGNVELEDISDRDTATTEEDSVFTEPVPCGHFTGIALKTLRDHAAKLRQEELAALAKGNKTAANLLAGTQIGIDLAIGQVEFNLRLDSIPGIQPERRVS